MAGTLKPPMCVSQNRCFPGVNHHSSHSMDCYESVKTSSKSYCNAAAGFNSEFSETTALHILLATWSWYIDRLEE